MTNISKQIVKHLLQTITDYEQVQLSKSQRKELYSKCSRWIDKESIETEINQYLYSIGYRFTKEFGYLLPKPSEQDSDLMTLELFIKFNGTLTPEERKKVLDKLFVSLQFVWNTMGFVPDCEENEQDTKAFTLTNVENEYSRGWDCEKNVEI